MGILYLIFKINYVDWSGKQSAWIANQQASVTEKIFKRGDFK